MLRLRPYKNCDAGAIVSWTKNERSFYQWSAGRFGEYPITPETLNAHYQDTMDSDTFFPFTAFDESGVVGHLIMRYPDESRDVLRLGFVIVDDSRRGMGCGKEMLRLALKYAFDILQVKKVTLGVFENNPGAFHCYQAVGFRLVPSEQEEYYSVMNERWKCLELEMDKES